MCADLPDGATLIRPTENAPFGAFCLFNAAIRQRHFFRRFDRHGAKLGHAIVGNARNRAGDGNGGERLAVLVIDARRHATQAQRMFLIIKGIAALTCLGEILFQMHR